MKLIRLFSILGFANCFRLLRSIAKHGYTLMALLDAVKNTSSYLKDDKQQLHYTELYQQALALAAHLEETYKLKQNSKVVLSCTNSIPFVKALFATSGLGVELFLLNPNQKQSYISSFISKKKIDLIIGNSANKDEFESLNIPFFNCEKTFFATFQKTKIRRAKSAIVILSSGSKGTPKEEKRKVSVFNFINPLLDIVYKLELKKNQSVLVSVPLFHGYGLASLLLSLFLKQQITVTPKFDATKTVSLLNTTAIDCWIAVPLMIQKVFDSAHLQANVLKRCLSGGDVLPISTIQKIHATTTTKVYNLYGTSETGVCTIATHEDLIQYPATIGSKITGVQCKIVNTNGNEISEGIGELVVCCKWVSDARSQNYVATGDLVSCNAAGFYFYKGRKDDLIVVGGENMYPIELETIIYKYPNIEWVKVSPFLDENQNTRVIASLALKNGMPFIESEFIHWLSTQTPAYSIPKLIEIVQEVDTIKLM